MAHRLTINRKFGASTPNDQEHTVDLDDGRWVIIEVDHGGGVMSTFRVCVDCETLLVKSDDGSTLRTGQDYVRFYPDRKE